MATLQRGSVSKRSSVRRLASVGRMDAVDTRFRVLAVSMADHRG
jgi:hypothetical protein